MINDLYKTKITCLKDSDDSDYYNVALNASNVRVVVSLVDFNGNAVSGKSVTLTVDNGTFSSVKTGHTGTIATGSKSVTGTTNSSGQFAVLYTGSVKGLITFSCNQAATQLLVGNFSGSYNDLTNKPTIPSAYTHPATQQCNHTHTISQITDLLSILYPVGAIYMSMNATLPSTLSNLGTWEPIEGKVLLSSGEISIPWLENQSLSREAGDTGGEFWHQLTTDEMPSHTHIQNEHSHRISHLFSGGQGTANLVVKADNRKDSYTPSTDSTTATNQNTGGNGYHNNMPPYLTVNMWQRTA